MGLAEATRTCFSKYVTFSGRASRSEFWWFWLAVVLMGIVAGILDGLIFGTTTIEHVDADTGETVTLTATQGPIRAIVSLGTFLPLLAAAWRRMQDTGRKGSTLFVPLMIWLLTITFVLMGALGVDILASIGIDADWIRMAILWTGAIGVTVAIALQFIFTCLILWWLTRPSEGGTNAFGPEPGTAA